MALGKRSLPQFMLEKTTNVVDSACFFLNSLQGHFICELWRLNVVSEGWQESGRRERWVFLGDEEDEGSLLFFGEEEEDSPYK